MRLTTEQKFNLKNQYNVETLYSFSRIDTFKTCPYSYYLKYILNTKQKNNIYSLLGNISHDIIQNYRLGKISYSEMAERFEEKWNLSKITGLTFSPDHDRNKDMSKRYYENMIHFFKNHKPHEYETHIESAVHGRFGKSAILGYIDEHYIDDEGFINIIDYKTSTKYVGKELVKKSDQLLIYSKCLHDLTGHPYNKMKIGFNFMKYMNVSYVQANGKIKVVSAERSQWVSKIKTPLKRFLSKMELPDFISNLMIEESIKKNNIDNMPEQIKDLFTFGDCIIYIKVDQKEIESLVQDVSSIIDTIEDLKKRNDLSGYEREPIDKKDEFFCTVICGVNGHCKYLDQMKSQNEIYKV